MITLIDYLMVSAALFSVGVYGLVTKKNAMRLVFSVEMLINAANINFVAFNRFLWPGTRSARRSSSSRSPSPRRRPP